MKEKISLLFTGDFCPQLRVEELILKERYDLIYNDLKEEFEKSDLSVVDLECPLTLSEKKIPKTGPHLKAHPDAVNALTYAGIGLAAMANNHMMDYGASGMEETLEACRAAGISTVGVGKNLSEARKPFIAEIRGTRVGIVNITENEWSNTHGQEPGANPLDLVKNFHDTQLARSQTDFVIVIFHGGNEFYELPSPRVKETLRFFVDAGACAVIGHHTHKVSGYEVYRNAPIFYSLGNFCFDWPGQRNSFWNTGFAVRLELHDRKVAFKIIPFRQNDDNPGVFRLNEKENQEFYTQLEKLNAIIADDVLLQREFDSFCRSKASIYDIYLQPYRNSWLASLRKRKLLPGFLSKAKKRLILNLTRCEAHRDVLIRNLEE